MLASAEHQKYSITHNHCPSDLHIALLGKYCAIVLSPNPSLQEGMYSDTGVDIVGISQ